MIPALHVLDVQLGQAAGRPLHGLGAVRQTTHDRMLQTLVHDLVGLQAGAVAERRVVEHGDVEHPVARIDAHDPGQSGNAVGDLACQLEHAALPVVGQAEALVDADVVETRHELDAEEIVGVLVVERPAGEVPGEGRARAGAVRDDSREVPLARRELDADDRSPVVEDQAIRRLGEAEAKESLGPARLELLPHPRVQGDLRDHVSRGRVAEDPRLLERQSELPPGLGHEPEVVALACDGAVERAIVEELRIVRKDDRIRWPEGATVDGANARFFPAFDDENRRPVRRGPQHVTIDQALHEPESRGARAQHERGADLARWNLAARAEGEAHPSGDLGVPRPVRDVRANLIERRALHQSPPTQVARARKVGLRPTRPRPL